MRVSRISVYNQPAKFSLPIRYSNQSSKKESPIETIDQPSFRGKFGAWVGGIVGTAAIVATAVLAAPAAICLAGGGAVLGAIGGHAAEDAINGDKNNTN